MKEKEKWIPPEEKRQKSPEDDWEKIDAEIHTATMSVRPGGICYPVSYKGIRIARLYCSGQVEFTDKENWKKGWEFKFEYAGDEKFFYRYIGK